MWGGKNTYINGKHALVAPTAHCASSIEVIVTFNTASHGQLATVIYEWGDVDYLGVWDTSRSEDLPVSYYHPLSVYLLSTPQVEDIRLHI